MTTDLHRVVADQQDRLARLEAQVEALINPPTTEDVLRAIWVFKGDAWFVGGELIGEAKREARRTASDLYPTLVRARCEEPHSLGGKLADARRQPIGSFDVERGGREGGGHRWRIVLCKVGGAT